MSSSQLQTLSNKFNLLLSEYQTTYDEFIKNIDSKKKSIYYSSKLQKINQQLIDINKEISSTINESYGSYKKNIEQSQEQERALQQNYIVLEEERQEIEQIIKEFQTINSAQENGDIRVTMYYYNYIILLSIVLLLIFLFFKFSTSSEQIGGGNKKFLKLLFP